MDGNYEWMAIWIIIRFFSGSTYIGMYHTGRNNGQQPHFHLATTPGVHYILGGG